jgi:dTDP-4-dehydrorhamnose 3,5-epimerase
MKIKEMKLKGVYEIQLTPHEDHRGFFMRTYDDKIFKEHKLHRNWVQENQSFSVKKNTVRGMHFQFPPHAETKLVRVLSGELYDVFIDLRKDSQTFGKWDSVILSSEKKNAIFIPRGFAHGTLSLTDNVQLLYKVDNYYAPNSEGTLKWNDPDIGIKWSINNPIVSEKDSKARSFKDFIKKSNGGLEL